MTLPPGFMINVRKSTNGCWHWTGHIDKGGYGHISKWVDGHATSIQPHRYVFEYVHGPLPRRGEPGHMQVDHECHNRSKSCKGGPSCLHRRCVNPAHLAAKTPRENGEGSRHTTASVNRAKTHCIRGHELAGENLRERNGKRYCYTCHLDRTNEARRKRLAVERGEGWQPRRWNAEKTQCPQGHPFDYVRPDGARGCRTCRTEAMRRSRARARAH